MLVEAFYQPCIYSMKGFIALTGMAQLVGASSHRLKDCGSNSQLGHIPRLWVRSSVGACTRWQPIYASLTHRCFSLCLPLPLFLKAMRRCPRAWIKKKKRGGFLSPRPHKLLPMRSLRSALTNSNMYWEYVNNEPRQLGCNRTGWNSG